jgi:hypothetical protein
VALDERLKRELERAGRPADPSGIYEDLIRRRERRRIVRKVESGVLAVAVVAVSVAGVYGLSRVFGEDAERDAATPSVPTPTPTPTPSPTLIGKDIGLGFPVCDVTTVRGQFTPGVGGTAYVATRAGDTACPDPGDGMQVLAVDVTRDGLADTSYGPLECDRWCSAFAAPDVDGDGLDEVLVQNIEFSVQGLHLFDVVARGADVQTSPVTVEPPGDPAASYPGFDGSGPPQFWIGGDGFGADALRCEATADGRVLISSTAQMVPPDAPDSVWRVHETTFLLQGDVLHVVSARDYEEPSFPEPGQSFTRTTGCGADLNPYD